jgi:hypothetical protein
VFILYIWEKFTSRFFLFVVALLQLAPWCEVQGDIRLTPFYNLAQCMAKVESYVDDINKVERCSKTKLHVSYFPSQNFPCDPSLFFFGVAEHRRLWGRESARTLLQVLNFGG